MGILIDKTGRVTVQKAKETCWESDLDTVKECGKKPSSIKVYVLPLAKIKINHLMSKFPNTEWLAYLVGNKDDALTVTDIIVPKQTASSGSVTNVDSSVCNSPDMNIIGVIHSHHTMGSFFSKTDDDWINQNNDISLCISNSGIKGQVRWKTPCGALISVDAAVELKLDIDFDSESFNKHVDEVIKKPVCVFHNSNIVNRFSPSNVELEVFDDEEWEYEGYPKKTTCFQDERNTLEDELKLMDESGMFDREVYNV